MTRRASIASAAAAYDEMPFSQLLFRYLWPFWLFKDATRGDRTARAAAYRHNRDMRIHLPGYLMKWLFGSALAFAVTAGLDSLATEMGRANLFSLMAAGGGIVFAGSLCMLVVTSYIYIHLGKYEY